MNCFLESCAIVRRALGHLDTNPCLKRLCYATEAPTPIEIPVLLAEIFPEHQVIIASPFPSKIYENLPDNLRYVGKKIPSRVDRDAYLWLFSYTAPERDSSHILVGQPVGYEPLIIQERIGVSIAPIATLQKSQSETVQNLIETRANEEPLPPIDDDNDWWELDPAYLEELQARLRQGMEKGTIDISFPAPEPEPEPMIGKHHALQPARVVQKARPQFVDVIKGR